MSDELKQQCKALKAMTAIRPDTDWKEANRHALLRSISSEKKETSFVQAVEAIARVFVPRRAYYLARGVFVFVFAVGLVTGGLVASASPLPGDLVFDVKIAVASATGNKQAKGELHMDKAKYQIKTLKKLDAKKDAKKVGKQIEKIKQEVASATATLDSLKEEDQTKAKDLAKEVTKKSSEIATELKEVSQGVKAAAGEKQEEEATSSEDDSTDLVKEVVEVRKLVNKTGLDAIDVLTKSIDEEEDVKQIVEEKIDAILEDAVEIAKEVEVMAGEERLTEEGTKQEITSTTPEVLAEDPKEAIESTESTTEEGNADPASAEVVQTSADKVHEIAQEVETLLRNEEQSAEEKITGVVEKVKALNEATAEAAVELIDARSEGKTSTQQSQDDVSAEEPSEEESSSERDESA